MHEHVKHTTWIKPWRVRLDDVVGRMIVLVVITIGVSLMALSPGHDTVPLDAIATVAPVDPGQIATLIREHETLRARLGVTVAPVDAGHIAALVRQHEALREQFARTVAPVNPEEIAKLIQQHRSDNGR